MLKRIKTGALLAAVAGAAFAGPATAGDGGAPAASLTPEALAPVVERYNRWVASIPSLSGGGGAVVGAPDERPRTFRFSIALSRPGLARMQGRWGNLTTVFDLAAAGEGWTLFLPRERAVVRSRDASDSAGLLVPPAELLAVLLPDAIDPDALRARGAWSVEGRLVRVVVPP